MDLNKVQLNCSLRFSPDGAVVGRNVLINIRENSVAECMRLLSQFKGHLDLGTAIVTTQQPTRQIAEVNENAPSCDRCHVPLIKRVCRKVGSKYFNKSFWSCPNWARNGCLTTVQV